VALRFREVVDHSPFSSSTFRWRMGVRALVADQWLQHDDLRTADLIEKARLTADHPGETFVARPGSESAAAEVAELVAADLALNGLGISAEYSHPLETAGLSVQEDLCVMELVDGSWILTAGSVCFPTRWDLPSKLGRSLAEIHSPVPDYGADLGDRVDRFFDRMTPGALAYRLNWSLVGDPSRRLGRHARQAPSRLPDDPASELFVRIERQTLRRLNEHDAVVFGIRIHVWPLGDVVADLPPGDFASTVEHLPMTVARYKNLDGMSADLAEWIRMTASES
jgi:hypothetical protein